MPGAMDRRVETDSVRGGGGNAVLVFKVDETDLTPGPDSRVYINDNSQFKCSLLLCYRVAYILIRYNFREGKEVRNRSTPQRSG